MKYSFFRKYLFLFLAFFSFLISLFFYVLDNQKYNSSLVRITKKISRELKEAEKESQSIVDIIAKSNNPTFASLLKEKKYSYFIFRNKALYFWSDYHFFASYESLKGNYNAKYIHIKNGKFIVMRSWIRKQGDVYEVFFFIPLSYHYSIENNYVSSGLNRDIFRNADVGIHLFPVKNGQKIYSNSQEYLFTIELLPHTTERNNLLCFLFSFAGIVFAFVYLVQILNNEIYKTHYKRGFLYLVLFLLTVRAITFYFNYPYNLTGFELFNSKYFASAYFVPSLGDFLVNELIVAVLCIYLLVNFSKMETIKRMYTYSTTIKYIIFCIIIILQYFSTYYFFYFSREIFLHSQWSADIMENITFDLLRLASLIGFVLLFIIFFIITHLLYRLIYVVDPEENNSMVFYLFLLSVIIFSGIALLTNTFHWFLLITTIIYFFIAYYSELPRSFSNVGYFTYIYFLVSGILFAMMGAYAIMDVNGRKTLVDKEHFFETVFSTRDELGEYLLYEAAQKIEHDAFVATKYLDPFSSKEVIDHKIRRSILSDYFDKYDITIDIFNKDGTCFYPNDSKLLLSNIEQQISDLRYKTPYQNIYFINDTTRKDNFRKYVAAIPLFYKDTSLLGTIIIELHPRRYIPYSVYPELLVDRKFVIESESKNYSYGIFYYGNLTYSAGEFDYAHRFDTRWLKNDNIFTNGIKRGGYDHLAIEQDSGRVVVITSKSYSFFAIFSNFSFLFFILTIFILLFIVIFSVTTQTQGFSFGFSTKIQIYLNVAFFLPLLIVCITILSVISYSYKNNLEGSFKKKAEFIRSNVEGPYEKTLHDQISKEQFYSSISQLARYTQTDIDLYNKQGKLLYSTQPLIYGIGILSRLINPFAFVSINGRNNAVIESEYAGTFKYQSVYITIKSASGETEAILSIPFFHSKQDINKQLINVLTTTLNIFVSIFILLLLLSYFASQMLTTPLSLITAKLRKTSLTGKNEPLTWNNSKDEIGMLIEGYNEMIVKLDESREALSRSEKEAAWREMAKQVAHEIKNPLTPMKLTIQHLQRTLKENKDDMSQVAKSMDVLLYQVNTLNEIASSFSVFAKMPVPKVQDFEISSLLVKSVALHNNTRDADVELEVEKGKFYVKGDEQLMGGIFTNLIINAIQAVPNNKKPIIRIKLFTAADKIIIEVRDNGDGIPEGIRDKVFNLNFSTKIGGSGIGLAVAKRGVEHAGGRIWFETVVHEGTSFFMELPLLANGFKK